MQKEYISNQPRMVITLGQTTLTLEPDCILYKHFKKQLGLGSKTQSTSKHAIKDNLMQVNSSSICGGTHNSYKLNNTEGTTSWSSQDCSLSQYIEARSNNLVKVYGILIQGRANYDQWVKKFTVSYSVNGYDYLPLENSRQFVANNDRNTVKQNMFSSPVMAKIIRINPLQWYGHISIRFQVLIE